MQVGQVARQVTIGAPHVIPTRDDLLSDVPGGRICSKFKHFATLHKDTHVVNLAANDQHISGMQEHEIEGTNTPSIKDT